MPLTLLLLRLDRGSQEGGKKHFFQKWEKKKYSPLDCLLQGIHFKTTTEKDKKRQCSWTLCLYHRLICVACLRISVPHPDLHLLSCIHTDICVTHISRLVRQLNHSLICHFSKTDLWYVGGNRLTQKLKVLWTPVCVREKQFQEFH